MLADSSGPGNAAEVVIGIFFPFREKLSKCEGYDIKILRDRMRLVQILKIKIILFILIQFFYIL